MISYVNNLIDVSKLANPRYSLKTREVNLSILLDEVVRKCKKLYIAKGTEDDREIITSIEPNLTTTGNEYYIRRSLENLIINAIQYCRKGSIAISLTHNGTNLEFRVKDSGIGIPQEELGTIFDPFVTSSKTTTPAGGRGMGLTLVKAVAEAHKGTVSVVSDGAGSTFTMILPKKSA